MFYLVNIAVVAIHLDEGRFSNHIKIFSKNLNILKDNPETFKMKYYKKKSNDFVSHGPASTTVFNIILVELVVI